VLVVGVDGCRGGWLAAIWADDGVSWSWTRDVGSLLALPAEAIAIDMPIGLAERGRRACDVAARDLLGQRRSTVFDAPLRPVLSSPSYAAARVMLAEMGERSMSAQAFGLLRAVRDLDEALSPADEMRVVEAHPELAFLRMGGRPLAAKKTAAGRTERLELLAATWPEVAAIAAAAPRPAAPDDALDALSCAWVARRWTRGAAIVIGTGERDARGLPMRIVS
jgi:predicted RNase H-like nuclease